MIRGPVGCQEMDEAKCVTSAATFHWLWFTAEANHRIYGLSHGTRSCCPPTTFQYRVESRQSTRVTSMHERVTKEEAVRLWGDERHKGRINIVLFCAHTVIHSAESQWQRRRRRRR